MDLFRGENIMLDTHLLEFTYYELKVNDVAISSKYLKVDSCLNVNLLICNIHNNKLLSSRNRKMWNVFFKVRHNNNCTAHVCVCVSSVLSIFVTPWTIALQAPLMMEFSRQEYWSGLPFPTPGDLHYPGIEPASSVSTVSPALAGRFFTTEPPGKTHSLCWSESVKSLSHVQLFVTPWTVAQQAPLSMEFPRKQYWSR